MAAVRLFDPCAGFMSFIDIFLNAPYLSLYIYIYVFDGSVPVGFVSGGLKKGAYELDEEKKQGKRSKRWSSDESHDEDEEDGGEKEEVCKKMYMCDRFPFIQKFPTKECEYVIKYIKANHTIKMRKMAGENRRYVDKFDVFPLRKECGRKLRRMLVCRYGGIHDIFKRAKYTHNLSRFVVYLNIDIFIRII